MISLKTTIRGDKVTITKSIKDYIQELKKFETIIIKFGRFIPKSDSIFDKILGIKLASENQFAEKIS